MLAETARFLEWVTPFLVQKQYLTKLTDTVSCKNYFSIFTKIYVYNFSGGLVYKNIANVAVSDAQNIPTHAGSSDTVNVRPASFVPDCRVRKGCFEEFVEYGFKIFANGFECSKSIFGAFIGTPLKMISF